MATDPTILIADDEPEIRHGLADLLSGLGLAILMAGSGGEALEIVRARAVDLALLDHQMPGGDSPHITGLDILRTVRAEELAVPCIFCSADAHGDLEQLALQAGAVAVLRKPVQPVQLRTEVCRELGLA